jgi:type I restriction enzyme S subunit
VKWKSYTKYNPSGVEWLGSIPAHWDSWKATHGFGLLGSGTTPKSDVLDYYGGHIPWVTTSELRENVITDTASKLTSKALQDYTALRLYPAGTLLFAMYGATIGRMAILGISATVNQACAAFSYPKTLDPGFTYYWLWMRRPILIALSEGGGQPNLSQGDLRQIRIPTPSLAEQRTIASFLDRETAQIDALIAKKERQIKLLQEKRAALISHAVTRGLDPQAKMKDSGIAWLGQMPTNWQLLQLRRVVDRFVDYRGQTPEKVESGIPLITARNIKNGIVDLSLSEEFMRKEDYGAWMVRGWPKKGDVLITTEAPLGEAAQIVDTNVALAQRIILLKAKKSLMTNEYLKYHFLSGFGQGELWSNSSGSTASGIKAERFKGTLVLVPPVQEQMRIVQFLDRTIEVLEKPLGLIKASIDNLREYRTALISSAVTGKIDVRGEVA